MSIDVHSGKIWPIVDSEGNGAYGMKQETLEKLLAVVEAANEVLDGADRGPLIQLLMELGVGPSRISQPALDEETQ